MTTTLHRSPQFADVVRLVAGREILARMRSKVFLISTGALMLGVFASIVLGGFLSGNSSAPKVAAVGSAQSLVVSSDALTVVAAPSRDEAESMLRDGEVEAFVVADAPSESNPLGLTVVAMSEAPSDVVQSLAVYPTVELLDPSGQNPLLTYLVALGFGLIFFMSALTFGSTIASSVVEEKQTRVVEVLLSTVSARALLTGKVLGNSTMALAQIVAIAALAMLGMLVTGQQVLIAGLGPSIAWFVVFFICGFVMLAAMFAATASLVSRAEDVGSVTSPITMLVMLPYFMVIIFNDNPTVLAVMSYFPFSAPVGMPMRVFLGSAEWWEPIVSLVILIATAAIMILLGERMYSNSLLRTGARVPLSQALKR